MDNYSNGWNNEDRDPFAPGSYQSGPVFNGNTPPEPGREPRQKGPKKPRSGALKVVALCLVCALLGAAIHPLYNAVSGNGTTTLYTGDREPTQINVTAVNTEKEMTTAEIYAAYVGSTVGITVDIVSTNIFGQTVTGAAAGSGFVITEDGYILTNYHVIENANSITVTFVDGKSYTATYIGGEEENDIAVIKIDAKDLTPVVIGSSDDMLVGEQVTAIGNPLGELTFTETTGIISALNRTITMSDGRKMNMIQTDCAINSGNSGGPLFNSHGEVIGIVSAKYSSGNSTSSASVEGLGFAIPMDDVADMVSELITNGYVTGKPLLGISVTDVNQNVQAYGVPAGAEVTIVTPGLCAEKAGLQAGDIVTKIDDTEVDSSKAFIAAKNEYKAGDTVELTVYRSGETLTIQVTLEESTPEKVAMQEKAQQEYQQQQQLQHQQQQQQQQNGAFTWPFGFGY
ncbi:MAG: trypsin-like peptidase domain-containing protein [Bacillota bacterium]|nr:trypsin-like peptidase domain-containing protein [Bacillota bacterium]